MTVRCASNVAARLGSAMLALVVLGAAGCGGSSSSTPTSPSPAVSVQYVSITGNFGLNVPGDTTQLRANAYTSAGPQDVTSQATWRSSDDSIATVSSGGLVSARSMGLVMITATYEALSGVAGIAVTMAVNVTGTWRGTATNPTSDVTLVLTQTGDAVAGSSTVLGGGATFSGSMTGTVSGGTVILAGQVTTAAGNPYASWTDERCALENANTLTCVNPMTYASGGLTRLEVTLSRR